MPVLGRQSSGARDGTLPKERNRPAQEPAVPGSKGSSRGRTLPGREMGPVGIRRSEESQTITGVKENPKKARRKKGNDEGYQRVPEEENNYLPKINRIITRINSEAERIPRRPQ